VGGHRSPLAHVSARRADHPAGSTARSSEASTA